jgi:hypothetical protein
MNGLPRRLARLYPRRWQLRYGPEFDALLEDTPAGWRAVLNVAVGALRMHLTNGGTDGMDETIREPKIIELASRDIPHGYELESAVEYTRPDGSTMPVRNFLREIDLGDSYITLSHSSRGWEPAETILVCGAKGEVDGDFRTDQTEMLVLRVDGTVQRTQQTVKTWLKYDAIRDRMRARYRGAHARRNSPADRGRELRQRERINSVDPARRLQLRRFAQQYAVQQSIAGHHRHVLFSVHRIRDGAH